MALTEMETEDSSADSELVERCLANSKHAWDSFYTLYHGLIVTIVRGLMPYSSKEDHEDVCQETYMRLPAAFKRFDQEKGTLKALVAKIARNCCLGWLYRKETQSRKGIEVQADHPGSGQKDLFLVRSKAESQDRQLLKAQLRVAIKRLREPCPELLRLHYYDELTYKEVAERLGKKENTVTVEIARCVARLRAIVVEPQTEGLRI